MNKIKYRIENKEKIVIRPVKLKDAERLLHFIQECARTSEHLLLSEGEVQYTIEEEEEFIKRFTKSDKQIYLVGEYDSQIIACASIDVSTNLKTKHIGELGIAIIEKYRAQGIGGVMMQAVIDWAKGRPQIEIIKLDVFETNEAAIALYKKMGFEEIAYFPNYFKQLDGNYVGQKTMVLEVRNKGKL